MSVELGSLAVNASVAKYPEFVVGAKLILAAGIGGDRAQELSQYRASLSVVGPPQIGRNDHGHPSWFFDGNTDELTVADHAELDGFPRGITIAVWQYTNTSPPERGSFVQKNSNNGYNLQTWDDGNVYWAVNGTANRAVVGSFPTGRWALVVGTYDNATLRVYWDGVEQGSSAKASSVPANAVDLEVGFVGINYWEGFISGVLILDHALRADQVRRLEQITRQNHLEYLAPRSRHPVKPIAVVPGTANNLTLLGVG